MHSVPVSPRDDLYEWLSRNAPDFLPALTRGWSDPQTAFVRYLETGDAGGFFATAYRETTGGVWDGLGYRDGTGRRLPFDMLDQLGCYFAERSTGATRLCWVSEDPSDAMPRPIGALQLQTILAALPRIDGGELHAALVPLLVAIAQGMLLFGSRPHRVVVVTCKPDDRSSADPVTPDPPAPPKEETSPPRRPSMHEAITQLIDEGHRPGRDGNMQWLPFRKRVIELSNVTDAEPGYSLDRIQEVAREILRKRAK
jgi:hypothetical protein